MRIQLRAAKRVRYIRSASVLQGPDRPSNTDADLIQIASACERSEHRPRARGAVRCRAVPCQEDRRGIEEDKALVLFLVGRQGSHAVVEDDLMGVLTLSLWRKVEGSNSGEGPQRPTRTV